MRVPFSKTCLRPGTVLTGCSFPSTQVSLGVGRPCAEQVKDPPVLLENPWKDGGS